MGLSSSVPALISAPCVAIFSPSPNNTVIPVHYRSSTLQSIQPQTTLNTVNMPFTASDICKIVLPPLGVFLERGCNADFFINILLTILGYIPGIIHALYIILKYWARAQNDLPYYTTDYHPSPRGPTQPRFQSLISHPRLLIPQTCYSRPRSVRPSTSPHTHEIDQESDRSWIMRDSERPVMRMDWCNMVKPITRLLDG